MIATRKLSTLAIAATLLLSACGDDSSTAGADGPSAPADSGGETSVPGVDAADRVTDNGVTGDPGVADEGDPAPGDTDEGDPVAMNGAIEEASEPSTTLPATTSTNLPTVTPTTLPADSGLPEGDQIALNEGGIPITLDETATLACALTEFARDALAAGDGTTALVHLANAADRAAPSVVVDLAEHSSALRSATVGGADGVVQAVLDTCVVHGHQI